MISVVANVQRVLETYCLKPIHSNLGFGIMPFYLDFKDIIVPTFIDTGPKP